MTLSTATVPSTRDEQLSPTVRVLMDRCAGCQECIVRCPTEALQIDPVTWTAVADDTRCVGCRQCVRTCPFAAIVVEGPQLVTDRLAQRMLHPADLAFDRSETRRPIDSWTDALSEASRCLACPDPTCVRGCPAHNDIPGFISAIRRGDLDEAHEVLRRTSVLPDICSRVCDQALQCEGSCSWSLAGAAPVAIGALERFVTDNAPVPPITAPAGDGAPGAGPPMTVAVVGSGPAGIAAAAELVTAGAEVTVFERDQAPGGLLRWGIPDFTLPEPVARRPWDDLQAAGVELRTGCGVGAEELEHLSEHYDAVVVAAGASVPVRLPVEGGDLEGIWDATRFLQAAQHALATRTALAELARRPAGAPGDPATRPARVLVLGAGNTAMDVARSARRLGADAICVDWMDRRFAPVRPDELDEATAEGVDVRFSTTVRRLTGDAGHVVAAELARTRQEVATRPPKVVEGEASVEHVDLVVMAMGYRIAPDVSGIGQGVPVAKTVPALADRRWQASGLLANPAPPFARNRPVGTLALGREHATTLATLPRRPRTWFVGDALVGPSTVVEAMAHGKAAARAIVHHSPRRPGRLQLRPKQILVATESRSGTTARIGSALAALLEHAEATEAPVAEIRHVQPHHPRRVGHPPGREAPVAEIRHVQLGAVGADQLAWADALVVGTWVEGAVVARVGPARATRAWLESLPLLAGMPVAVFCSYGVAPKRTLATMRTSLEARGATVVAEAAFRRGATEAEIDAFARTLRQSFAPQEITGSEENTASEEITAS